MGETQKIERRRDCRWMGDYRGDLSGNPCGMGRFTKVNPGWYACVLGRPVRKKVARSLALLRTSVARRRSHEVSLYEPNQKPEACFRQR